MFRQKTGSVVCASCGSLVGVNDDTCYNCGRRNPGLWGFGPVLRRFGNDLGFMSLVVYGCIGMYFLSLVLSMLKSGPASVLSMPDGGMGSLFSFLGPTTQVAIVLGASGGFVACENGRWWTVLSAGWLHGGALHILFNLIWVQQLGPAVADTYGAARMVIIYTLGGAAGFAL